MSGAAKRRANKERESTPRPGNGSSASRTGRGSSSGETSSSGKATSSAKTRSPTRSHRSTASRRAGYDGNEDVADTGILTSNFKNLDLGAVGWGTTRGVNISAKFPPRPAPSTLGKPAKIALNTFNVEKFPDSEIYQFDVVISGGTEKKGLIMKVWESKAVQKALGGGYIFDGNKLAWGKKRLPNNEVRLMVDLDAEQGREPKEGKDNSHRFAMKETGKIKFDALNAYLQGQSHFDKSILECINFYDHMLREHPRGKYTQIKRSFFARDEGRFVLGGGAEAFKGVYQSMRVVNAGPNQPARLSINLDVSNGTFWTESPVHLAAQNLINARNTPDLIDHLRRGGENSRVGKEIKKLRKLHVVAKHRGKDTVDEYCIERIVWQGAKDYKFEKDGKMISIYDYFLKTFNVRLQWPDLPLLKMTKGKNTVLPMELLRIKVNQRYVSKLDDKQTAQMIKFAVTPPVLRWQAIEHGLKMLDWPSDPVLKHFGTRISQNRTVVEGRILQPPIVKFGKGEARPGTSGRWDLKAKGFLTVNPTPLKVWGVCVVPSSFGGKPDKTVVENFVNEFIKTYVSHGGKVENKKPFFCLGAGTDVGSWVTQVWNGAGNQQNARPQMLMFVLPTKDPIAYGRIKRSCDCRYGVVSQCVQYMHAQKCQPQYLSNVCMKFNAKLGGSTSRAMGPKSSGPNGHHDTPTLIMGADVSHAAPGAKTPSMAALTMSMDKLGIRYAAACETNGFRQEMMMTSNINSMMGPLLKTWINKVGSGHWPGRIIYLRDGVSEGQYQHILDQEVSDMKKLIASIDAKQKIPMVVIVSSKRHHVRFFPQDGDKNQNPLPGTLVESGVTNPYENDFYLNSHSAIKGTARPMHYHVLLNEAKMSNDELQMLIYEQCYQYIRATTPISQHPAIYYAHIVSNRAVPHDPKWQGSTEGTHPAHPGHPGASKKPASSSGGSQGGGSQQGPAPKDKGKTGLSSSQLIGMEANKLMPMPDQGGIQSSMWFI